MDTRKVRATIVELFSRVIKAVENKKDVDVYHNDIDNLYPNRIERIVNNSPTAKRASKIMAKYIAGKGLVDESRDVIVNEEKNYKVSKLISLASIDRAEQGGAWFHIGFGIDVDGENVFIKRTSLDLLDYPKCRKAVEDDENNIGKIIYKDYCKDKQLFSSSKGDESKWFYPYNYNQEVIKAQIEADYKEKKGVKSVEDKTLLEMLPYYRGQVYYYNSTPQFKYALAPADVVYNDCDSEYRISLYLNGEVRLGFMGKTAILTQGLDEELAEQIKKDIADWLGSENSNGVYHLDFASVEDIDKVLKIIQVKGQYDEKMFADTRKALQSNILGAFNSVPEILVLSGSGTLFGTSGEAYEQAKIFYNEQTEEERWEMSDVFTHLGFPCEIKPIVDTNLLSV